MISITSQNPNKKGALARPCSYCPCMADPQGACPKYRLAPFSIYTEDEIKATAEKNPSKRLGKTEDTANLVLFLLSDKADYINGENVNVNGGILLK